MQVVEVKWNPSTKAKLEKLPDKVVYAIARATMDSLIASQFTPWKSGKMERSMAAKGVQKDGSGYYIGNFTDYASRVYNLPQNTNWSRKTSKAHWLETLWHIKGDSITNTCIARYKL